MTTMTMSNPRNSVAQPALVEAACRRIEDATEGAPVLAELAKGSTSPPTGSAGRSSRCSA